MPRFLRDADYSEPRPNVPEPVVPERILPERVSESSVCEVCGGTGEIHPCDEDCCPGLAFMTCDVCYGSGKTVPDRSEPPVPTEEPIEWIRCPTHAVRPEVNEGCGTVTCQQCLQINRIASRMTPGEVYVIAEPEFIGRIPIRSEPLILGPDPPSEKTLGWPVCMYDGTEVYKFEAPEALLTGRDDIKPGDVLLVSTLIGPLKMRAVHENGELWAESEGTVANLEFDKDNRHCWVSTMAINKKLLRA